MSAEAIVVLGSTGSIGRQALDVVRQHDDRFMVYALVASSSVDLVFEQCNEFRPQYVYLHDALSAEKLSRRLSNTSLDTEVVNTMPALEAICAAAEVDTVISAIVGAAGLVPTLAAARAGKKILLANKESLVMAGTLLMDTVHTCGATILPVDSEHNALFQSMPADFLCGHPVNDSVTEIVLTASGGPFLNRSREQLAAVTPAEAVAHPNWSMGAKISVDSATMMNKVLEVIEAHFLFSMSEDKIEVVIHPQSIVHSMVRYCDGSVLAQLGNPDMRTPIAYCLGWPERIKSGVGALDFSVHNNLSFQSLSLQQFPCAQFIKPVIRAGQCAMIALNAANEVAVSAFLDGMISYLQIYATIDRVLAKTDNSTVSSVDDVLYVDALSRRLAKDCLSL